jgi:lactate dehydrogenase-like 2-hydroxyacid dehydrogenase
LKTPNVLTETTAELGFTLMLATARRIVEAEKYVEADAWQSWGPYLLSGKDVFNSANNVSKETYVALKSASASLCLDRL